MKKEYIPLLGTIFLAITGFFIPTKIAIADGVLYTGSRGNNGLVYEVGNKKAAVTFVEFQAQMCPYSREFHLDVFPKLKKKYIDTGKVLFVSMPYAHNDDDIKAMKLVQCADDKNYWPLMEEMYRERDSWTRKMWKGKIERLADEGKMRDIVTRFGVNKARQDECLNSNKLHELLVTSRQISNMVYGVFRTPQYVINGKLYNELSWADVDFLMQKNLATAEK